MENDGKKIRLLFLSSLIMMTKTVLLVPRGTCKYVPSCSEYAADAIKTLPFPHAVIMIIKRIIKCSPLSRGGFDPVPLPHGK
jgi:uncharacterized protein